MKKLSLSLLLMGLVCLSGQAFGQAARFDSIAQTTTTVSATNTTVLVPLSGATITVCGYPYNGTLPCTNKASVCPDATMVGCTTGAPNNPITADSLGNFGFWAGAGSFDYTVCAVSGACQGPYHAVLGVPNPTNGSYTVDGISYTTIQAAITAAGTTGYVVIPSNYAGSDTYTNPNGIQVKDRRTKPDREFGYINAMAICGLAGAGVSGTNDEGAALNTCLQTWGQLGRTVLFPKTQAQGACDYYSSVTLSLYGNIRGEGSIWNAGSHLSGTNICFAPGVTGLSAQLLQCRGSCAITDIGFFGGHTLGSLQTPTNFVIPAYTALTRFDRTISSIQVAANEMTVTVNAVNGVGEKLFQSVGSTVRIRGVVGDATLNGLCVIDALSGQASGFTDNASTFTCPFTHANSGPFVSDGTVSLPTNGTDISDGMRICGNFYILTRVSISGFGRDGINGDANSGEGCPNLFADDLSVRDSSIVDNQVSGFFTRGTDSSVDNFDNVNFYYNGGYCADDSTALGNTYVAGNCSNNGKQWASPATPATKNITSVNRVSSDVAVVLATADANIKVGSCVVIAGVTDASFNNTAGQCYFVTSVADTTHYHFTQPGNPVDASSSGGTSRYAKFSETYLSSGMDSGSWKMSLGSSGSADTLMLNVYVEGGQPCKLSPSVLVIQGTNTPCSGSNVGTFFNGSFMSTQYFVSSAFGANITNLGNKDDGSGGYLLRFHAGRTVSNHEYLQWETFDNNGAWRLDVLPTGTNGANGSWHLTSDLTNQTRILLNGSNAGGNSYFNGTGTGEISLNRSNAGTAGSGGMCVYNGSSSVKYGCINTNGVVPGTAAGQSVGTNALPFSSAFIGAAATNNAQLTGTFTGARVQTLPDVTGTVSMIDAKLCGTTSTCANTTQTLPRIIFGSVALASATPSAITVSGISPAFTSTSSYFCTATPVGATAAIAAGGIAVTNVSSSSFTLTGPNTVTTVIDYTCVGN